MNFGSASWTVVVDHCIDALVDGVVLDEDDSIHGVIVTGDYDGNKAAAVAQLREIGRWMTAS